MGITDSLELQGSESTQYLRVVVMLVFICIFLSSIVIAFWHLYTCLIFVCFSNDVYLKRAILNPNLPEYLQDLRKGILRLQGSPDGSWTPWAGEALDLALADPPCQLCPTVPTPHRGEKVRHLHPPRTAAFSLAQVRKSLATGTAPSVNALPIVQQGRDCVSTQPTLLLLQDHAQTGFFFFKDFVRENHALKFLLGRHSINHPAGCLSSPHRWDVERDSSSINKSSRLLAVSYKTAACNSMLWKEYISLCQYMLKVLFEIIKKEKDRIWPKC